MTDEEEMLAKVKVLERTGTDEVLAQLAEEATELAQAALKVRRALDGSKNPTPVTLFEAQENLIEEMTDVLLCESMHRVQRFSVGYGFSVRGVQIDGYVR